ncbi:MAG: glycosyltransferase family 4 protein [Ktedonobacterales bacterium]|nr:glycosyltransferase family 4 protein [Ktedonobacterales bacterium]
MTGGDARTPRPVRVLFLHPSDELYGSDQVLLNLVRGLDRTRFEPLVVLGNDVAYEGRLSKELAASGIACRHMSLAIARRKYFTPTGLFGFWRRLRASTHAVAQLIREERIDLIHSNTLAVWTGALAAAQTRRPHIWHVHELIERPAVLRWRMRRFVPRHAARVISVAQVGLDDLLTPLEARAKGLVLYNGLEGERWMRATGRERIRAELGCSPDDVLVGMVARISSFKAPDLFVAAASHLVADHPRLRCFLAGGPVPGQTEMLERVRGLIAASPAPDRIRLLGFRDDAPDLMAALDVLVQPSRDPEMCSMTLLQAMFAGKPVVATDVGGNKELVRDGETGSLVPREDVAALTIALGTLVADGARRQAMGQAGRERALAHFTLDRQVQRFNAILEDVSRASAGQ